MAGKELQDPDAYDRTEALIIAMLVATLVIGILVKSAAGDAIVKVFSGLLGIV